jgi:SAM-dependent methyltransferase
MRPDDKQTRAQEGEYAFPYHYLPTLKGSKFSSTRHWDWGFRYLGGMQLALDQLAGAKFDALVDIGCGDGRFLREVAAHYPAQKLLGVDASERAVRLAQALNPDLEYRALDIVKDGVPEKFGAATLIEVIEHIPPAGLPEFIRAVAGVLSDGGRLVLTVPHRNKPLIEKHYQHFTGAQLETLLAPHFRDIRLIPFDVPAKRAPTMWLIERLLGAKGKWFLLTNARLLYLFYRLYLKRYLYAGSEARCERIAVVGTKKPK